MTVEHDSVLAGRRILVAEDEGLIALQTAEMVSSWGCVIVGPVPTVSAALRLIQAETVDAAVLDYRLRDGTSDAVAEALEARDISYVLITSLSADELSEEMRHGARLHKPVKEKKLLALLTELVGR